MLETNKRTVLAVGAHPDDIEFGCGGILLKEAAVGSAIHLVICSNGESGSNGSLEERVAEAEAAAREIGASLDFLEMGGDGQIAESREHAFLLAGKIRGLTPDIVLAPTTMENQHPDHAVVGKLTRDACRFARYGGLKTLPESLAPHSVGALLHYAVTPTAEPDGATRLVVDISEQFDRWQKVMHCHASQMKTRNYLELQVSRSRCLGLSAACDYAQALFSADDLLFDDLAALSNGARHF